MWIKLRNLFITGLVVLFPVVATLYLVSALFRFADGILGRRISPFLSAPVPGLGAILTLVIIILTGLLATNILGKRLINLGESLLLKTPFVRGVYATMKQIVDAFVAQNQTAFKRVALIQYPRKGIYSLAFLTGESKGQIAPEVEEELVHVFLPTTPNPTSGFMLMLPRSEVVFLNMKVEDGLKMVISGGVLVPSGINPGKEATGKEAS